MMVRRFFLRPTSSFYLNLRSFRESEWEEYSGLIKKEIEYSKPCL